MPTSSRALRGLAASGAASGRVALPTWRSTLAPSLPSATATVPSLPLKAAAMIAANVEELNRFLAHDLREPIRFGIGIHGGEVIIGDIGYRDHMVFTALGDAVNVAARLQDMTKNLSCEVVVSDEVRATAGLAADALPQQEVAIRGRNDPMIVRTVTDARTLSTLVNGEQSAAA